MSETNSRYMQGCNSDLITAYVQSMIEDSRSVYTIKLRKSVLKRADAELPYGLDNASKTELLNWALDERHSPETRLSYLNTLRCFYAFCEGRYLDRNPLAGVRPPRRRPGIPRPITDEQLERIVRNARQPFLLWSLLAAYEGARCIEISRLRRQDINESITHLFGKGNRWRAVPTDPQVWEMVKDLPDGRITETNAHDISTRTGRYFRKHLDMRISLHMLRHWYLTRALENIGDPRVVQTLAGHASLETTMVYTQVAFGRQVKAVEGLPRFKRCA